MATATTYSFKTTATSGEGGDYELPPAGSHPAVLIGLVDMGTTESVFNGEKKDRHKILLAWELTAEMDSNGNPFVVTGDYTWSLNSKAQLRKIVEGFRGKAMGDNEEFDLAGMLGQPCMVSLSEGTSSKGKKFIEVTAVAKPPRGMTVPPASHEPYLFHWGAIGSTKDDFEIPSWMPKLYGRALADDLKATHEYAALPAF